jgi:hypothetical protein
VLVVASLGLVAACGGGSSDSSSDGTTTTKVSTPAPDPSAAEAARAASVTPADVGTEWSQFRKSGGFVKVDESCITDAGTGISESDKFYSGPMFRDTSETAFIYTYSYVFRTEAEAQAFTAMARSEDFLSCKEKADDAAQKKRDAKTFVRMTTTTDAAVGSGGLEAYYVESPGVTNPDGTEQINGSYARYYYRSGRVVYVINVDAGTAAEPEAQALGARADTAIENVRAAIEGRLQALEL